MSYMFVESFRAGPGWNILVLLEICLLYMFRIFRLSVIRSLLTVHSTMVYVIQVCRQLSDISSVHHQEFINCSLNNGVCHTGL